MFILDCTLRDGGYYNSWNFPTEVVNQYLHAMASAEVDIVELGLRSLNNSGFKGAAAFTTDEYLSTLAIPQSLKVAVMVNASELLQASSIEEALASLFPTFSENSKVDVVRIACHIHEFEKALPASTWLKEHGYSVGFNLMQIAERSQEEIESLAQMASTFDIDVLYFADSMGSMNSQSCKLIIQWLRKHWSGDIGIHTHDNLCKALDNTLTALDEGVTWLDATVTGMGRGPGNARVEELLIEIGERKGKPANLVPLLEVIKSYFQPLKNKYGWGSNPFYYLSGKYGIHPTFVQEMLCDPRYSNEDIVATLEHLHKEGGSKFCHSALDASRNLFQQPYEGSWKPKEKIANRQVLILGAGASLKEHQSAIKAFINKTSPIVIALNTQNSIDESYIDLRVASHPIRIFADYHQHLLLPQPLVTPLYSLPDQVKNSLREKEVLDFGLDVQEGKFQIRDSSATVPNTLAISYALSIVSSGLATKINLAGFDGFGPGDKRTQEMQKVFKAFLEQIRIPIVSITPTEYDISTTSVYGVQCALN